MSAKKHVLFLLGSGASRAAGIPMVSEITERVLSGDGFFYSSDASWLPGKEPSYVNWNTTERLGPIRRFMNRLKVEIERYYDGESHSANYEEIHFLASQVHDALNREYENPAVLAFLEELLCERELLEPEPGASLKSEWSLPELARETTEYIHDLVASLLHPTPRLDVLPFLVDACGELAPSEVTLATLNHDTLVEKILESKGFAFRDGFGPPINNVRYFDSASLDVPSPTIRLLKVHGSVNWFRVRPDNGTSAEERVAIFGPVHFYHSISPDGRPQIPEQRPMLLIGTFNKSIRYTEWFYSEIFSQFQAALKTVDSLVICGYGFGDKGINSQITQRIYSSDFRRAVVIHPHPENMKKAARGAIQRAFEYLDSTDRLQVIAKRADEVEWSTLRILL